MTGRAAILGLGRRGRRWAETCRKSGWDVVGFDPDDRAGPKKTGDGAWRREKTISATVKGADWVFCCLPERLELMRTVIRRAQAAAPDDAIIAVMSPSFDIEAVQGCSIRPSQVLRVTEGDDGELVLDLNSQNRDGLRDKAKDTFAGLSAVLSLSLADEPVVDTEKLSKKA